MTRVPVPRRSIKGGMQNRPCAKEGAPTYLARFHILKPGASVTGGQSNSASGPYRQRSGIPAPLSQQRDQCGGAARADDA